MHLDSSYALKKKNDLEYVNNVLQKHRKEVTVLELLTRAKKQEPPKQLAVVVAPAPAAASIPFVPSNDDQKVLAKKLDNILKLLPREKPLDML